MKKIFLLLIILFSPLSQAEEKTDPLEKPVQCAKLFDLMRQTSALGERFAHKIGDVDAREKEIYHSWGNLTLEQRQYIEKECTAIVEQLSPALENLDTKAKDILANEQVDFPSQCESAISLMEEANTLMSEKEKLSSQEIKKLNNTLRTTWRNIDYLRQQKMINACAKMETEVKALIEKRQKNDSKNES